MNMKYKIVSFDMDGTLTIKTTCLQYYINKLGEEERAKELERRYRGHEIDDKEITDAYITMLKGVTRKQLLDWTNEIPIMKHIASTVQKLKKLGLVVGIISVGPYFASEVYQKLFNFDFISGTKHVFKDGIHTGQISELLWPHDKPKLVESVCRQYRATMSEVIAVGDSRSDIALFEKVGFSIALNADENLRDKASAFIYTDNLLDVYEVISQIKLA